MRTSTTLLTSYSFSILSRLQEVKGADVCFGPGRRQMTFQGVGKGKSTIMVVSRDEDGEFEILGAVHPLARDSQGDLWQAP